MTTDPDSTVPPLPQPNRYITDNDAKGHSFFSQAIPSPVPMINNLGGAFSGLGYVTSNSSMSLNDRADLKEYERSLREPPPLVPSGGAAVWFIDTPPGGSSPMHRTISLDIVVQLEGELELTLDSGEKRTIKPGDLTVQRSTMHTWRNLSATKWSRMLAVMSECQPVVVGNQTLGTEM